VLRFKISSMSAVAVAALALVAIPMTSASAAVHVKPLIVSVGALWPIANVNSGLCLSVPGASRASAAPVDQWECGPNGDYDLYPDQEWEAEVDPNGGGYYIVNINSGECLSVPGASKTPGVDVNLFACNSAYPDQDWQYFNLSDGTQEILNANSGLCLSVPGASKNGGVDVNLWTCGPNGDGDLYPDQHWD